MLLLRWASRVAGQIVRCWIVDVLFSEKGFEAVDITGCLIDPVACARDECAVSFDPLPVLVPGRSDLDRQVWPAGKEFVVLGLLPEDRQHCCGVVVCAVRFEGVHPALFIGTMRTIVGSAR